MDSDFKQVESFKRKYNKQSKFMFSFKYIGILIGILFIIIFASFVKLSPSFVMKTLNKKRKISYVKVLWYSIILSIVVCGSLYVLYRQFSSYLRM
jgi:hypothetical protein